MLSITSMATLAVATAVRAAYQLHLLLSTKDHIAHKKVLSCSLCSFAANQPFIVYSGSFFLSVFSSGPTFRRLYVTLYATTCFFPGFRSRKYFTCC